MLPNFLIIGSQKAGTTTLYEVLRSHPYIFMPAQKEVNFFFLDELYSRGSSYYAGIFAEATRQHIARGEASPGYICHPETPARIKGLLPDIKLILTIRHPVERAYSQYWDNRRKLSEYTSFESAVAQAPMTRWHPGEIGYLSRGLYLLYIRQFLDLFERSQLLVLLFDDLVARPQVVYEKVCAFLDLSTNAIPRTAIRQQHNASLVPNNPLYRFLFEHPQFNRWMPRSLFQYLNFGKMIPFRYPTMQPATRELLVESYRSANCQLGEFLEVDLDHWNQ